MKFISTVHIATLLFAALLNILIHNLEISRLEISWMQRINIQQFPESKPLTKHSSKTRWRVRAEQQMRVTNEGGHLEGSKGLSKSPLPPCAGTEEKETVGSPNAIYFSGCWNISPRRRFGFMRIAPTWPAGGGGYHAGIDPRHVAPEHQAVWIRGGGPDYDSDGDTKSDYSYGLWLIIVPFCICIYHTYK